MSRRRKRWLRRLQQWRHQRQEQRRQRAEAAAAVPQPLELETLEPRVLLTTLFGGEIFEYQDAEENTIRVALEGDGLIVELIGGEADEDGTLRLGDLPGRIISSFDPSREGINIGGGLGGEEGVNVIGETPVLDLSPFGLGTFTLTDGPNEAINIEALAGETDEGEMFGFNFGTVDVEGETLPLIQLVRMDANDEDLSFDSDGDGEPDPGSNGDAEGFVNAILSQATLGGDVEQELSGDFDEVFGIDAFSVDPDDPDIAYALSEGQLYKIFREARTENGVEYEAGDVQRVGPVRDQQTDAEEITDTTRFAADLIGFSSDEDGSFYSLFKDDLLYNGLFVNDGDDNAPVQSVNGDLGDNYNFVALAVREIDDAADLTYAVNEAEDGSLDLYQIERDAETGAATDATRIGVLTDVDGNPISGVRSMTFNEEGELFVVGSRPGRAQELFQITPAAEDLDGDEVSDEVRAQHLSLAFSRDGDVNGLAWDADAQQFYGVVRVGGEDGEDRLLQIPATTSAGPADSAVLTDPGDVSDYITGLSSDQLNQFYSIFNRPQMNGALLFNAFDHIPVESVGNDLLADFDVQGLAVVSRPFSVEEPSGANAATALGILAADTDDGTKDGRIEGAAITTEAEPLSTDTTLAELGITPVVGTDLRFVQQDGTVFTVDLSEAETLGQALNEINNATGGDVEARINDTATGLVLIDNSTDNVVESSELVFLTTNDGGDLELRVAQRDSSGALSDLATINLGDLEDSGGNPITDVFAMESDVTGRFYFVGTVGGQRTLFQAVINRSDDGTPTDYEIESEAAVALGGDVMALAMSDRLDRSTLHAVVRNGAQDQLVQFGVDGGGALDGTVDPIGFVQVEDADGTAQDTRIKAMAFDPATGHLVAVDDSLQDDPDADEPDPGVENRRRLVRIVDSDDDGTLDPADSVQQTTPGSVPASLRGYGLDEAGNLYSVADVGVEVDGELVRADQLWTTGNNFSPLAFVNGDLGPNRPFIELTVTPDGEGGDVFAIAPMDDGSGIGLYRIDGAVDGEPGRTAGTGLTFLGEITDGFGAAIDGIFDIESDADGNLLLVGRNIEAPLPVVNVGQTDQLDAPGTDYDDLFALTVTDNERIFAIDNVSGGGFELLELERLAPNRGGLLHDVIELGELRTASNQPLGNVETITTDMDTGKVYIVGSVSGAANAPRQLFEVNIGNGIAINPVDLTDGGAALEQAVSTMAFADGELYLTVPESGGEQLYRVQTDSQGEPTGELEALGEILASDPRNDDPPVQVTLEAMAANSEGELVAVFDDGSARRMLVLSADAPGQARFTTADGGDPDDNLDDVVGLASDPHGLFYSLHNPGTGDNIQLRSNSNTIYRIDPATDALQDLNGDDLAEEVQGTFVNYLTRENPWSGPSQQIPIVNDVTQIAFIDDGGQGDLHAIVHFRGEAVPFTDTRAGSNEGASIINLEQTHGRFDVATGEFHEVAFPNDVTVTLRELLGNVTLEGEDDDEVVVTTPMGDIVGMDANGAEELILVVEVGEDENGDPIREVQRIHLDAHWIIHRDRLFPNDEQDDEFDVEVPATEVEPLTAPSAIDHNLVGFASDGEGDVFYSIYDDGLLHNFLVRSFYDVPYDAEDVGTDAGHLPQPVYSSDLGAQISSPGNIERVATALTRLFEHYGTMEEEQVQHLYSLLRDVAAEEGGANFLHQVLRDAEGAGTGYGDAVEILDAIADSAIGDLFDLTTNPQDLDAPQLAPVLTGEDLSDLMLIASAIDMDGDRFVFDSDGLLRALTLDREDPLTDGRGILDNNDTSVDDIAALAADPTAAGVLYLIGIAADALVPTDTSSEDLGSIGDLADDAVGLQIGDTVGDLSYLVRVNSDGEATLYEFDRDGSGNVNTITEVEGGDGLIEDAFGSTIQDISALTEDGDGNLLVAGFRVAAPAPNANVGGNLSGTLGGVDQDGAWHVLGVAGDSDPTRTDRAYVADAFNGGALARLIQLDRQQISGDPDMTLLGEIRNSVDNGAVLGITALTEADSSDLFTIGYDAATIAPQNDIGALGVDAEWVGLAVRDNGANGSAYALDRVEVDGEEQFRIRELERDNTTGDLDGVGGTTTVQLADGSIIRNIDALEYDRDNDRLLVIGSTEPPEPGEGEEQEPESLALFEVDLLGGGEIGNAKRIGTLDATGMPSDLDLDEIFETGDFSVTALSLAEDPLNPNGDRIFAVLESNDGQRLLSINPSAVGSGEDAIVRVSDRGELEAGGEELTINRMDTTREGGLVAGSGDQLIDINRREADASTVIYQEENLFQNRVGLASDQEGRFLSLNPDDDALYSSDIPVSALYTVDKLSGTATKVNDLDLGGDVVNDAITALAVDPGTGTLYGAQQIGDTEYELITIDDATGAVTQVGTIEVDEDGDNVGDVDGVISAFTFNADEDLVAFDDSSPDGRRLIQIDLTNPDQSDPLTDPTVETIDARLAGLGSNADGRFYSVLDRDFTPDATNQTVNATPDELWVSATSLWEVDKATAEVTFRAALQGDPESADGGGAVVGDVVGIDFGGENGLGHAVVEAGDGSQHLLTGIQASGGDAGIGTWPTDTEIEVAGDNPDVDIRSVLVRHNGAVIAIDGDQERFIRLVTTNPGNSQQYTGNNSVDPTWQALSIDDDGRTYTLENNGSGTDDLLIGSDPDAAAHSLYQVDAGETDASDPNATLQGTVTDGVDPLTETVNALAVDPDNTDILYAVYRDGSGQDQFITLDLNDADGTSALYSSIGVVQTTDGDTNISGFDFAHAAAETGGLLAVDNSGSRPRLVRVDLTNPDQSEIVTVGTGDTERTQFIAGEGETALGFAIDPLSGQAHTFNSSTGDYLGSGLLLGIGFNLDAPVPTGSVGGSLGTDSRLFWLPGDASPYPADFNIIDITVAPTGEMYALNLQNYLDGPAEWELWRLDRDPATGEVAEFANVGTIAEVGTGQGQLDDIHAIDYQPLTGNVVFIGTGNNQGPGQHLFSTSTESAGFATISNNTIQQFDGGEGGLVDVTTTFTAMAIHQRGVGPAGAPNFFTVYAVTESDDGVGQDILTIDVDVRSNGAPFNTPVGTVLNRVELPDEVLVSHMDFNRQGTLGIVGSSDPTWVLPDLIAIDDGQNDLDDEIYDRRLIQIDPFFDALSAAPDESAINVVTDPSLEHHQIPDRIVGFASDPSDGTGVGEVSETASPEWGRFFSVLRASSENSTTRDANTPLDDSDDFNDAGFRIRSELWISGNDLFTVSPDTGMAFSQGPITQFDPDGPQTGTQESDYAAGDTLAQWEGVYGIAYSPDAGEVFAIQRDLQDLYLVDDEGEPINEPSIDRLLLIDMGTTDPDSGESNLGEFQRIGRVMARPTGVQGDASAANDSVLTEIHAMAFDADGELIAVDTLDNSTLQIDLRFPQDRTLRMSLDGDYNQHLYGLASDANGHFYAVWDGWDFHVNTDDELWQSQRYVPTTNVNGDLGGISFGGDEAIGGDGPVVEDRLWSNFPVPVAVTIDEEGNTSLLVFNPDLNRVELFTLDRDPITGEVLNDADVAAGIEDDDRLDGRRAMELQGHVTDSSGNRFLDLSTLAIELESGELYTIGFNAAAPIPDATVGGELGGQFDVRGLAVTAADQAYVIAAPVGTTTVNLYRVERNDQGQVTDFALVGPVGPDGGPNLTGANSLVTVEVDGEEQLWTVADGTLFAIDVATGETATVADLEYTQFLPEPDSETFPANAEVKALVRDPQRDRLYFVFDEVPQALNPGLGSPDDGDFLASASLADLVAGLGGLRFDGEIIDGGGNDTDIVAAAVNSLGHLIAIDRFTAAGTGEQDHRLVRLDLTDPLVNNWQVRVDAEQITTPGSVDPGLEGLAIDSRGRALAIQTGNPGDSDQLWASSSELMTLPFADEQVDANGDGLELELVRNQIAPLNDGRAVTEHFGGLAFRGEGDEAELFALRRSLVTGPDQLVEISMETGDVSGLGGVITPAGDVRSTGIDFTTDGRLIGIDMGNDAPGDSRMVEIVIPELAETIGVIQVDGEDTDLQSVDFVADPDNEDGFRLVGFDDSQEDGRRLVRVDLEDPTNDSEALTDAGTVSEDLLGLATGNNSGRLYSIFAHELLYDALMVSDGNGIADDDSDDPDSLIPRANVSGDFGDNFDMRALTVGESAGHDAHMIVWDDDAGQFLLYRIDRNGFVGLELEDEDRPFGAVLGDPELLGPIRDENGVDFADDGSNFRALERGADNELYAVADADGGFDGQELFQLVVDEDAGTVTAVSQVELTTAGQGNIQNPVTALAAVTGGRFQAIVQEPGSGGETRSRLIEINPNPAPGESEVTTQQVIEIDLGDDQTRQTEIIGFDTDPLGTLVAVDEFFGQEDRRLLEIGSVLLVGEAAPMAMAFGRAGESGTHQLYVISQDYDADPTADASGDGSNSDVALIEIDKETGEFNRESDVSVIRQDNDEVNAIYTAMAFDPEEPGLFHVAAITAEGPQLQSLRIGGEIQSDVADLDALINSLAFATQLDGEVGLVGVEIAADGARLLGLTPGEEQVEVLSAAGTILPVGGLGHFTDENGRELLLTSDGFDLIRGTAVTMPTGADGASLVESVLGADTNPLDNHIYFTAAHPLDGDSEGDAVDFLYRIDPNAGSRAQVQASMERVAQITDESGGAVTNISSLVWNEFVNSGGVSDAVLLGVSNTTGELFVIDPDTGAVLDSTTLQVETEEGVEAVEGISGIELVRPIDGGFAGDDPAALNERLVAVQRNGADSQLLAFDLTMLELPLGGGESVAVFTDASYQAEVLGALPDPDDEEDEVSGENIGGLAWHGAFDNPATGGSIGGLLATDVGSDELLEISPQRRFEAASLFNIHVARSSPDARISIARVPDFDPDNPGEERRMEPYQDSAGEIRVFNPDAGEVELVDAPADSGSVYIGVRTPESDDDDDSGSVPLIRGELEHQLSIYSPAGEITAGLTVAEFDGDPQSIGRVLIGGTVTGAVDVAGSIDLFYAGWLITGNANPFQTYSDLEEDNFSVGGDLQNLIVRGSIGGQVAEGDDPTELAFQPDTHIRVAGRIGQVVSVDGSVLASVLAENDAGLDETLVSNRVVENVSPWDFDQDDEEDIADAFQIGELAYAFNTFDNPYYLPSLRKVSGYELYDGVFEAQLVGDLLGEQDVMVATGTLLLENEDSSPRVPHYYGVPLMAGQTISIQLDDFSYEPEAGFDPLVMFGLFDPDGRLVATNYERANLQHEVAESEIQYTADRPGTYRVAVGYFGDTEFVGEVGEPFGELFFTTVPYELTIRDVGPLAVGGVRAMEHIHAPSFTNDRIGSLREDFGAIHAGGSIASSDLNVGSGSLRSVVGGSVGVIDESLFGSSPRLHVPDGDIGLVQNTDEEGILDFFNDSAIGGSYQVIDAAGTGFMDIIAGDSIGVIRIGGTFGAANAAPSIEFNTNRVGGTIDLIHVAGDMGGGAGLGPDILAHRGGNVRYIIVEGELFQSATYGGGSGIEESQIETDVDDNTISRVVTFNEDSGGPIAVRSTVSADDLEGEGDDEDIDLEDPETDLEALAPILDVRTFGIGGEGGGVVVVDITASGSVEVFGNNNGSGEAVEIGRVIVAGEEGDDLDTGEPIELDPETGEVLVDEEEDDDDEGPVMPLSVIFRGVNGADVDVFSVEGGTFDRIINETGGELINAQVESVRVLHTGGNLGYAFDRNGLLLNPVGLIGGEEADADLGEDAYPFVDQRTAIHILGSAQTISARGGVGNIVVEEDLGRLVANSDNTLRNVAAPFEGVNAPVLVRGTLFTANVGQGIAPTGSGAVSHAGLYSETQIRDVISSTPDAYIRGNIVVSGDEIDTEPPTDEDDEPLDIPEGAIVNIAFNHATIAGAKIITPGEDGEGGALEQDQVFWRSRTLQGEIGNISISGRGGIIGADIAGLGIGNISVANGFGIINTDISSVGNEGIGNIVAGGLGLRSVFIDADTSVGNISALGDGEALDIRNFTDLVRQSESGAVRDRFGQRLTSATDLHLYTGQLDHMEDTSRDNPVVTIDDGDPVGTIGTNAGAIDDVTALGVGKLGRVSAWSITNSTFNFANEINGLDAREKLENVEMLTGRMRLFQLGVDAHNFDLTVAGKLDRAIIRADLLDGSSITASGPSGDIGTIIIFGDLEGDINAVGSVRMINVHGDVTGNIDIDGAGQPRFALNMLRVAGSLEAGSLSVDGDINTIFTLGDLGSSGEQFAVTGDLNNLRVGGAFGFDQMTVQGDLRNMMVLDGGISGDITVLGDFNRLMVRGGDVEGDLVAGGDLRFVNIINGDLADDASLVSATGDIFRVLVRGGDLLGDVRAPNGEIRNINVIGSDAGGLVEAGEGLRSMVIHGSLLDGAEVNVGGEMFNLIVRGGVQDGATIDAGGLRLLNVRGHMLGDLTVGDMGPFTRVIVGANLGNGGASTLDLDGDAMFIVRGNVGSGVEASLGSELRMLNVRGQLRGEWLVDGMARNVIAGSMSDAVITTGFDLWNLNVRGNVDDSLVQAGVARGDDGTFATGDSRMGDVRRITVNGQVRDSIFAAGGEMWSLVTRGTMFDSSASTGLVVNAAQLDELLAGNLDLDAAADRNALRTDATLYNGDFRTANINGAGLVRSHLSAGTDAGADGDFDNVGVTDSLTGGASEFRVVNANVDANSSVLADGGIRADRTSGSGLVDADIDYDLTDIIGTALNGVPVIQTIDQSDGSVSLNINGRTLTLQLRGPGQVHVYHSGGDDVDALVLDGTESRSRLSVETSNPGALGIERVLSEDDAALRRFDFNGDIVGSGTATPDLWIDGGVTMLSFRNIGEAADFDGRIGSDVNRLQFNNQQGGELMIGGDVIRIDANTADSDAQLTARDIRILRINGGPSYDGRIEATGGLLLNTMVQGHFDGEIVAADELRMFRQLSGAFNGSIETGGDARIVQLNGGNVNDGQINVGGELFNFMHRGDTFDGTLTADSARMFRIDGAVTADSDIDIDGMARIVTIGGSFAGDMSLGESIRTRIDGNLASTAELIATGDVRMLDLGNQVNGNPGQHATVSVGGDVRRLTVGSSVHGGQIGVGGDVFNAMFRGHILDGIFTVGGDLNRMTVNSHVEDSVISAGTWWGDDAAYNTDDDVIRGGSIGMVQIGRDMVHSVVAAGVLPGLDHGEGIPDDLRAYTGHATANDVADVDSAEAGGLRPSTIDRFIVRGGVFGNGSERSALVAADDIGTIQQAGGSTIAQRVYEDPVGVPELVGEPEVVGDEIRLTFSEPINTASLTIETDSEPGAISLRDGDGDLLTNLTLDYDTVTSDSGEPQGMVIISSPDGLPEQPLVLTLSGGGDDMDEPAIYGRSGGRSALRDFNQDGEPDGLELPFGGTAEVDTDNPPPADYGTIFDGDGDGIEGGDAEFTVILGLPSTFDEANIDLPITTDGGTESFSTVFGGTDDRDIYRFAGSEGEFLSASFAGTPFAHMGLFWHNPDTDQYELVVRHQAGISGYQSPEPGIDLFDALELPEDGTYYLVVAPDLNGFGGSNSSYTLEMTLASSAADLVDDLGGELPEEAEITTAQQGKQLIYLNFDGGTVSEVPSFLGTDIDAFDIDSFTDFNFDQDALIDQIVTNIGEIYTEIFTQLDGGVLDGDLSDYENADEGLFFTTERPEDLDPSFDDEYSTVLVGDSDGAGGFGLFGIANHVDAGNMSKDDEAIIFTETFGLLELLDPFTTSESVWFDRYSNAFANVIAHEAGHYLGLNHTERLTLDSDLSMMAAGPTAVLPTDLVEDLWELDGSAPVYQGEFPLIGDGSASTGMVNQSDLLLRWLSSDTGAFPLGNMDEVDELLRMA